MRPRALEDGPAPQASRGPSLLHAFRDELAEPSLRRLLERTGGDAASTAFRAAVGDRVDLARRAHREALLAWLRSWGCRHLRVADTGRSSAALARWWRRWAVSLPAPEVSLVELTTADLGRIRGAYASLASAVAAGRARELEPEVAVAFGDTAAAKALHALRPRSFPPWDRPIRLAFGRTRHDGALYRSYLEACADALRGCAARLGVEVDELPARLGRPGATPARLVDEYLWLRVTRGA
jgi:hypothetical protein